MPITKTLAVTNDFKSIGISLASAETILSRSHGEVLTPETINYRTFKPEMDGLFCEKIFGPVKDYECHCGKYKRIRYKGIICDRCGVEVTRKAVRRERMGHITLTVPVVHIWYFKSLPNKIAYLLGLSSKNLDRIVYYETFVIINPGLARDLGYAKGDLISEEEKYDIFDQLPEDNFDLDDDEDDKFIVKEGADALAAMLADLDLDELAYQLRYEVKHETSQMRKKKKLKRLQVIESFRTANQHTENRPEWMCQSVIPVIPPELRPLVPLEGGRKTPTSNPSQTYYTTTPPINPTTIQPSHHTKPPTISLHNPFLLNQPKHIPQTPHNLTYLPPPLPHPTNLITTLTSITKPYLPTNYLIINNIPNHNNTTYLDPPIIYIKPPLPFLKSQTPPPPPPKQQLLINPF